MLSGWNRRGMIQVGTFLHLVVSVPALTHLPELIYPNGVSCSLPEEVQESLYRSIPGLENVRIVRPAYGVEYDHVDPRELGRMSFISWRKPPLRIVGLLQPPWKLNVFRYRFSFIPAKAIPTLLQGLFLAGQINGTL